MRQRKKYSETGIRPSSQEASPLTDADKRKLAGLVRKYGLATIVAAADKVQLRGPGRPSRANLPYFERVNLADTLNEWAEEYRLSGSRKPLTDALLDFYEIKYGDDPNKPDFQTFQKTTKRRLCTGRKELRALKLKQLRYSAQKQGRK